MEIKKVTHVGMVRDLNEDTILSEESKDYSLLIIADGMGGHNGGEVASSLATETIRKFVKENYSSYNDSEEIIRDAILLANKKIYEKSKKIKNLNGMGTTVTCMLIINNIAYLGHVGDSRAYKISQNTIKQITEDHSYIEELLKKGAITLKEAENHPMKNLITRAVGTDNNVVIDTLEFTINKEDIILMCSDGLTRYVTDEEILKTILSNELDNSIGMLLNIANKMGGKDNISIIVARREDYNE